MDADAEALVRIAAKGEVGAEEDGEVDVGFLRDASQQGGLVLDGVTDQVGELDPARGGFLAGWGGQGHRVTGLILGGDQDDGDEIEEDADAAGADGGFDRAAGEIEDVVGLEDGVGILAEHDALDIDVDQDALAVDSAEDAEVVVAAVEERATAEGGGFEQGEGGVLLDGNGAGGLELAEQIDDANAGENDGVAGVDGDVGLGAAHGVGAELDDDGFREAGTVDGDGVAGRRGEGPGGGEDFQQMADAGDGDDGVASPVTVMTWVADSRTWRVTWGSRYMPAVCRRWAMRRSL